MYYFKCDFLECTSSTQSLKHSEYEITLIIHTEFFGEINLEYIVPTFPLQMKLSRFASIFQ